LVKQYGRNQIEISVLEAFSVVSIGNVRYIESPSSSGFGCCCCCCPCDAEPMSLLE